MKKDGGICNCDMDMSILCVQENCVCDSLFLFIILLVTVWPPVDKANLFDHVYVFIFIKRKNNLRSQVERHPKTFTPLDRLRGRRYIPYILVKPNIKNVLPFVFFLIWVNTISIFVFSDFGIRILYSSLIFYYYFTFTKMTHLDTQIMDFPSDSWINANRLIVSLFRCSVLSGKCEKITQTSITL